MAFMVEEKIWQLNRQNLRLKAMLEEDDYLVLVVYTWR